VISKNYVLPLMEPDNVTYCFSELSSAAHYSQRTLAMEPTLEIVLANVYVLGFVFNYCWQTAN
jgi:hypothetical protein